MRKTLLTIIGVALISVLSQAQIVITEIMYNPPESGTDSTEFVELYNAGGSPVDLQNYTFSSGITFTFSASTVVAAGGYAVLAVDAAAFQAYYGVPPTGQFSGALGNGGEPITLRDGSNAVVDSVNYDDAAPWPLGFAAGQVDGGGASLMLCNAAADNNDGNNWAASTTSAGITINGFAVLASPFAADAACSGFTPTSVSFTVSTGSSMENAGVNDTLWVALASPATSTDSIYLSLTDISATYGVDYTTTPDMTSGAYTAVVAPGDSSVMIVVTMIDDGTYEGNETFTLQIDSVTDSLVVGTPSLLTYTIMEDDISVNPVIDFSSATTTVTEGDAPFAIAMTIAPPATQTDTIWVKVTNGAGVTYGGGNDYTIDSTIATDTFMIFINNGDATTGYNFTVNDDAVVESNETVAFTIVAVSGSLVLGSTLTHTVTIQDNDIPAIPPYSIATVTTVDGTGVTDSLNVTCQLTGIVYGENFRASSTGMSFTLIDNTGGIACFSNPATFGYTVQEGDSIVVTGDVGQFNGLTQLYLDTVILISSGHTLQPATVVTTLGESEESELIQFDSLNLVNPSQWTGTGSGFTVDVTNGTNTFQMRIDNDCDLFSMPVPTYAFRLRGIGGQFDNSSPFDAGYQILPRRATDIDSIGTAVTPTMPTYPIGTVNTVDGTGVADSLGVTCKLVGIVYGSNFRAGGLEFTLIDNTGGIGVFSSASNLGYTVTEGDSIEVQGSIDQFFGLTQIKITSLDVLSSGHTLKTPLVVTTLSESTESDLVQIVNVTLDDPSQWTGTGSGFNVDVTDDLGNAFEVRIDADCELYSQAAPTGELNITGIGGQFDSSSPYDFGYQLLPRYAADIEAAASIADNLFYALEMFPNPAREVLNVKLADNSNARLTIIDVTGKVVKVQTLHADMTAVNVQDLNQGMYIVKVATADKVYRNTFIKK